MVPLSSSGFGLLPLFPSPTPRHSHHCSPRPTHKHLAIACLHPNAPPTFSSQAACRNLFLLDVPPLCYRGKKPSPSALVFWLKSLFRVTANEPIIAVLDGEKGNEYRKNLLPTYKGNRSGFVPLSLGTRKTWIGDDADLREAFPYIKDFMEECSIPIVSMEDAEADDVVASLAKLAVLKGMHVKIASPDKDFKQLLCDKVQIVAPLVDLERWSFYTHEDYFHQHNCHPVIELSLRCLLGDKIDNIPGLADFIPGFGRKTAIKLLMKYGSLENLLHTATKRTVAKPYVQEALITYEPILRRNLAVLRLRSDLPVTLKEEWCFPRKKCNDVDSFLKLENHLNVLRTQRILQDGIQPSRSSLFRHVRG